MKWTFHPFSRINAEIVADILSAAPKSKIEQVKRACYRNYLLTSTYGLDDVTLFVYTEGYLVEFRGTRCAVSIFAADHDGSLVIGRKPNEKTMHPLYATVEKLDYLSDLKKVVETL